MISCTFYRLRYKVYFIMRLLRWSMVILRFYMGFLSLFATAYTYVVDIFIKTKSRDNVELTSHLSMY